MDIVYARQNNGEKQGPDKDFTERSTMSFVFDIESQFRVTTNPSHKGNFFVKSDQDWADKDFSLRYTMTSNLKIS